MRRIQALTVCLLLAACGTFTSKAPLFVEGRGACPFAEPAAYANWAPDAPTVPLERTVFVAQGNYCVASNSQSADSERILFVPIERNVRITQSQGAGPTATYRIVRRDDPFLAFYLPLCSDYEPQALVGAGVEYSPGKPARLEKSEPAPAAAVMEGPVATDQIDLAREPSGTIVQSHECVATRADGLERLFRLWRRQGHKPITVSRRVPADPWTAQMGSSD